MKRVTTLLPLVALGLVLATAALATPRTYTMDRAHSEVGFNVRHFFNKTHGRFEDYDAKIVFDADHVTASTAEITIRDSSIYTANEKRDNHLRTADFFWYEKYPTITFKSTKVIPGKDKNHFSVNGDLTIRGITKPAVLAVEYIGMGPIGISGRDLGTQAGFTATTTVNRKDYGIVWNRTLDQGGAMLGDDVEIVLSIAAVSRDEPPAGGKTAEATQTMRTTTDKK